MNKTIRKFLLVSAFVIQAGSFKIFAQAPNQFSYQAVIRDANGKILESKPVNIRISILQGSTTGNSIFFEEHTDSTNTNGLVSLQIGSKVNFNIDWSQGPFFIKTELKNIGEANYVDYGTTQMLSVPYALYAEKSGSSSVPGPKGDKGDKGDTGSQGLPGKDGVDGKNGLDGKDGLPGAQGLKGDKGDKGDTGSQGIPGKDGVDGKNGLDGKDGLPGAQGLKGDKGDKGDTGPIGLTGPKGDTGSQGIPGKDGVDGKNGLDGKDGLPGAQGLKGDKGDKGDTGSQGIPGKDGVDGKNGLDGKDGLPGAQGLKGDKGDKGDTGSQGIPGKDGVDGKNGLDGKDGVQGIQGPKGDIGLTGPTGPQGLPGKDGAQGPQGIQGPKGDIGLTGPQGPAGKDGKVEFQNLKVSVSGDTLYLTNGNFVIIPGLSAANPQTKPTSGYGANITDIDGNSYKTVYIGTQQWMGENLKTSKYSDGTPIPNITDNTQWSNNTTGAWAYYNNDVANNVKYGKLYNWYAVNPASNGNKNVCPTGWHVPTEAEWTVLIDYLGGTTIAGSKLKESGTSNWALPNSDATNSSMFTALPGGTKYPNGSFKDFSTWGTWWSANNSRYIDLNCGDSNLGKRTNSNNYGFAIRCLKD